MEIENKFVDGIEAIHPSYIRTELQPGVLVRPHPKYDLDPYEIYEVLPFQWKDCARALDEGEYPVVMTMDGRMISNVQAIRDVQAVRGIPAIRDAPGSAYERGLVMLLPASNYRLADLVLDMHVVLALLQKTCDTLRESRSVDEALFKECRSVDEALIKEYREKAEDFEHRYVLVRNTLDRVMELCSQVRSHA